MNQIVGGPVVQSEADRLRARVAWLYHVEGHTQNEIANRLGINRVMVVRMLAEARRRNEVRISITSPLSELVALERALEAAFDIRRVVIAPFAEEGGDPAQVIAAAAGARISRLVGARPGRGGGWGDAPSHALPLLARGAPAGFRGRSLRARISPARPLNPAEFAWQFAELFRGEGYLVPAPAVVDSPETKYALLERCGLAAIFEMADKLDVALLSVGGIANLTTSYRTGYLTEADRRSLVEAGAVGDVLYNFIDAEGNVLDHEVNERVISVALPRLRRTPERILVSGGREKRIAIRAALRTVAPTTLITDEQTASALLAE